MRRSAAPPASGDARWPTPPRHVDQAVANLKRGLAAGKASTADSVGRTLERWMAGRESRE